MTNRYAARTLWISRTSAHPTPWGGAGDGVGAEASGSSLGRPGTLREQVNRHRGAAGPCPMEEANAAEGDVTSASLCGVPGDGRG